MNQEPQNNLGLNNPRTLVVVFLGLVVAVGAYSLSPLGKSGKGISTTPDRVGVSEEEQKNTVIIPDYFNSSEENLQALVQQANDKLADETLTPEEKLSLLIDKAFLSSTIRTPFDTTDPALASIESLSLFAEAYNTALSNEELSRVFMERIKFGFLYNFATNGFFRVAARYIPDEHRDAVKNLPPYDPTSPSVINAHQRAAFQSMIDYAYTDPVLSESTERSVLSHRMYVVATYLANYEDVMSPEEKSRMLGYLASDFANYPLSVFSIFTSNDKQVVNYMRGIAISAYHMAVAQDIFRTLSPSSEPIQHEVIDAQYNALRTELATSEKHDKVSLGILGALTDSAQLSSLHRRFGSDAQAQETYKSALESLQKNLTVEPAVGPLMRGHYTFLLSVSGGWNTDAKRIFDLADQDSALARTIESLGVSLPE